MDADDLKNDASLMLLRLFQRTVLEQCEYLLGAVHSVNVDPYGSDVWRDLQAILLAAANLSKLLWGKGGTRAAARAVLRDSIGVADDSPLRLTRMRNHFEHIDERLDTWFEQSPRHNYAERNIGPKSAIGGLEDVERFRQYDPETGILMFWGDELNVREIEAEVSRIYPRVKIEAGRPHWER